MATTENINPRTFIKRPAPTIFALDSLQNPLPGTIKDSETLHRFFSTFPYIPYATSNNWTSQSMVSLLKDLRVLSNTQNACVNSKGRFAFGGTIRFRNILDEDYDTGMEPTYLQGQELKNQIAVMKYIDHYGLSPKKLIQASYKSFEETGDIWIEVILGGYLGVKSAGVKIHDQEDVLYRIQTIDEMEQGIQYIGICKDWSLALTETEPIRHVPLYPNFMVDEDGRTRTMIHYKWGNGDFYGRPPSQGSLPSQYNEYQDSIYLIKISNKNFTGQIIYEMEDDGSVEDLDKEAQKQGYRSFGDQIEKMATNASEDPMTFLAHTRPMGAAASVLHQIKPNTSEGWYSSTGNIHRERIIVSHSWSERLLGISVANGFDSNVYLDEAYTKEYMVLQDLRREILSPINDAYSIIYKWLGLRDDLVIDMKSPIEIELEKKEQRRAEDHQREMEKLGMMRESKDKNPDPDPNDPSALRVKAVTTKNGQLQLRLI